MNAEATRDERLLRRLATPGALLLATPGARTAYAVYPAGDRRTRPTVSVDEKTVRRLTSHGVICAHSERSDALVLTEAGRARLRRQDADHPNDAFRVQHQLPGTRSVVDEDGGISDKRANLAESPLAWLRRRSGPNGEPFLSSREFVAGERLRQDHERSAVRQSLTSDWTAPLSGRTRTSGVHMNLSEGALYARQRVQNALRAVGPGLDSVLESTCLRGASLDMVEREAAWPRRSAKVVLKLALARLADHYGLAASP